MYHPGDIVYIIENKHFVREVEVVRTTRGVCTVRFADSYGGFKIRESKLFLTRLDAKKALSWSGIRPWHPD